MHTEDSTKRENHRGSIMEGGYKEEMHRDGR
jgi:hypothetical protein